MLKRASNAAGSSATVPPPSFGAFRPVVRLLGIASDLHRRAPRAGYGAADEHQVSIGQHLDHRQAALRHAAAAHPAGTANALKYARGRRRSADRTRRADVVRAVRGGTTLEVVSLDRALEALALRAAGDLDLVARGERLD